MTSAALFILALQAAAITIVFVRGSIFERVRDHGPQFWQTLAGCPLCAGVWIGFIWSLLNRFRSPSGSLENLRLEWVSVALDTLAVGALTGTIAFFAAVVLNLLEDPGLEVTLHDQDHDEPEGEQDQEESEPKGEDRITPPSSVVDTPK